MPSRFDNCYILSIVLYEAALISTIAKQSDSLTYIVYSNSDDRFQTVDAHHLSEKSAKLLSTDLNNKIKDLLVGQSKLRLTLDLSK